MEVLGQYIRAVRDAGYDVLPPDINESKEDFTVIGEVIRLGLSAIGKVGDAAVANIIENRTKGGKFASLWDFLSRIDTRQVNRGVVENLIKSGAFDSLDSNRAKLLNALPQLTELAARKAQNTNQASLFGDDEEDFFTPRWRRSPISASGRSSTSRRRAWGSTYRATRSTKYEPSVEPYITCPVGDPAELALAPASRHRWAADQLHEKFSKAGNPFGTASSRTTEARSTCSYSASAGRSTSTRSEGRALFREGAAEDDRGVSLMVDDIYSEEEYKESLESGAP